MYTDKQMVYLSWQDIFEALEVVDQPGTVVYGVPKGGMIASGFLKHATITHLPGCADIILDDIVDSGATRDKYTYQFPGARFVPLYTKDDPREWVVFPWEADHPGKDLDTMQENITRLLQFIGEDPSREGLVQTPDRVISSYKELFQGYNENPEDLLTTFDTDGYDQIIICRDIELFSMCEHHMLPFSGVAHVAYIPNDRVIGLSKLARLVDIYARRLQIQERIGEQVTNDLMYYLQPKGAACVINATHMCMRMRGVSKQQSSMITSSVKGVFFEDEKARKELMDLIKI